MRSFMFAWKSSAREATLTVRNAATSSTAAIIKIVLQFLSIISIKEIPRELGLWMCIFAYNCENLVKIDYLVK